MKRSGVLVLVGLLLLLIPIAARMLWFYRGTYQPPDQISIPAFSEITIPQLPLQDPPAPVDEPVSSGVVLIDTAHSNRFEVSELDTLTRALAARGATVELLDPNADFDEFGLEGRLKYASAFVVVAPFESFSAPEVESVRRFVERGGRLLVILDPTRSSSSDALLFGFSDELSGGDVTAANQLLEPLDLEFSDDYLYDLVENEGNFRNVFFERFNDDPLTNDLSALTLYAARSVFTNGGTPLMLGGKTVFSSRTDAGGGLSAAALSPNERALALGDLSFLQPPYDNATDNRQFIENLADYLVAGERDLSLQDLPFVFQGPVSLIQSADFVLQAETLSALQTVKEMLAMAGIELMFPEDSPAEGDRIVLGLFDPEADLEDFLAPFEIKLPADDPDGLLHVPGFGSLNPTGIGVVGVARDEDFTTLVLLAEDEERLVSLLESMSLDLLEGCIVQGAYSLCKVGDGEGFGTTEEFEFDTEFEETFTD